MHVVAITGGAGFVGRRLAAALLDDAALGSSLHVRLLDVRVPEAIPFAPSLRAQRDHHVIGQGRLSFVQCDLRSGQSVLSALAGVDTVFHLASYGMSGREMLNIDMIRSVNLGGTRHILHACCSLRIPRLVYVSTYNVVFGGQEIVGGQEDQVPYFPLHLFHDEYSRTKRQAEELVLQANSKTLSTCSIRPAAIYGDGEERHLPRILKTVRAGFGLAAIGSKDTLCDWLYVDNLCHALILAASSLAAAGCSSLAAGQAYCISDDAPMNNFAFLRPLCEGLGYRGVFRFWVPTVVMFHVAWALELVRLVLLWLIALLHLPLPSGWSFQPPLTRAEVAKVGVTHYFSQEKARAHLGYAAIVDWREGVRRCIEFYREEYGAPGVASGRPARKDPATGRTEVHAGADAVAPRRKDA